VSQLRDSQKRYSEIQENLKYNSNHEIKTSLTTQLLEHQQERDNVNMTSARMN